MGTVRKIESSSKITPKAKKLKVAAYCRVSTDNSDQVESLEAQKAHYESFIKLHSEWEYAGLYYDLGITGTKANIREGLQNMIIACKLGKIDHILVKSISRFSRNTTDCLSLVRNLLGIGVTIYFEKENINTGEMESELILSILSSMAEEESFSISQNEKWAAQKRFQNGSFKLSYLPYGYSRDNNGQMIINQREAPVVKYIFDSVISGLSTTQITELLRQYNIPTRKGGKWSNTTVRNIISNEKYTGDALLQKTYTDSEFRRHRNNGEVQSYLINDHHPPIISHEVFEKANALVRQRAKEKGLKPGDSKYQQRYSFSGIIICSCCGSRFKRRIHNNGKEIAWACSTHIDNIQKCPMQYIRDDRIKAAFATMINKLIYSRKLVLRPLLNNIKANSNDDNVARIRELQGYIEANTEKKNTLRMLRSREIIDNVVYNQELNKLSSESENYRNELNTLNQFTSGEAIMISELESLIRLVENTSFISEFNDDMFISVVDNIIVYDRSHIGFKLKCGLTLKEEI